MRKTMRMFFPPLSAGVLVLAAGFYGNNAFAQDENQEKKTVVNSIGLSATLAPQSIIQPGAKIGAVKNFPFSAELVCESNQALADGNRIVNRTNTIIYRDGEGRIRKETSFKIRDPKTGEIRENKVIQVSDPFGGLNFSLDPQNRTAQKFSAVRQMKEIVGVTGLQSATIVADRTAIAPGSVPTFGLSRIAGVADANMETKNESLGTQVIEGVAAYGTRITQTIPAGAMNNERPIETIIERWYSNELKIDLLLKTVDPRFGESTQQMTNINRGEPDASLFVIPPDYSVNELRPPVMSLDNPTKAELVPEQLKLQVIGSDDRAVSGGLHPMTASLRPTILYKEKGKYTEDARHNRVEGTVVLNVVFTADGKITSIRVLRGLPDGLTEKAIEAAHKIRFNPAVKDGVPVSVRGSIEFTFTLDQ